jgi:hypothetical protein
MGYKFQFITLAGFHSLNYGMFDLAYGYARNKMSAFVELQEKEFAAADRGFTAVKHQREVGTGYFDAITQTIQGGKLRSSDGSPVYPRGLQRVGGRGWRKACRRRCRMTEPGRTWTTPRPRR